MRGAQIALRRRDAKAVTVMIWSGISHHMQLSKRSRGVCVASLLSVALGACATLPASGPTGSQIYGDQKGRENRLGFGIIELDSVSSLPPATATAREMAVPLVPGQEWPSNLIGPNDILDIAVYEAGVALFSGGSMTAQMGGALPPGANAERLPSIKVDDQGFITIPYAGRVMAAGHTTTELQSIIEQALVGRSQSPQAVVSLQRSVTSSVILSGEVARSGRLMLETNRETILDAIALAGGYRGEPSDLLVKIERNGRTSEIRLDDLQRSEIGQMRIFPGDRITLLRDQESFSVMGAAGQTAQIPFNRPSMSLAEAIARAGGSNDNRGDPAAIFVFRYVPDGQGNDKPTVYHIDMMKADSYFLSQKFVMQDRDILFVGNARANQPRKMVETLSQLFTPILTIDALTRRR